MLDQVVQHFFDLRRVVARVTFVHRELLSWADGFRLACWGGRCKRPPPLPPPGRGDKNHIGTLAQVCLGHLPLPLTPEPLPHTCIASGARRALMSLGSPGWPTL